MLKRVIAASLLALIGFSNAALAADAVTFQMSWIPSGEYAPLSAGIEKGFFRDVDIELTMTTGRGSGDAVSKVAAGVAPFGDGDISALMTAQITANASVKALMPLQTKSPQAIFVLEGSGINSFADLPGKTLATTPGNSHYLYFPRVAKMAGIEATEVSWTTVDAGALAPMLLAEQVDGATLFALNWYYQNKAAEKQGKKIKIIPFADEGFSIYAYCIYGNTDFVKKNPDLTRRFISAVQRSYLWARDNVQEAAELHKKHFPDTDVDDSVGTLKMQLGYMFNGNTERDGFGTFNMDQLKQTYEVVADAQKLPSEVDASRFVDASFIRGTK